MKDIILPGTLISETPIKMENTYLESGKTFSKVIGIYDDEKKQVIPLEGNWLPKVDDIVVGVVSSSKGSVYEVELFFFGRGLLIGGRYEDIRFKVGDVVEAKVKDVEDNKVVILWDAKVLRGGTLISIKPSKVPRVVGRNNTMVEQIARITKSSIVVGTNGIIWLRGDAIDVATAAIRKIEREAHTGGLTDRIKIMLENEMLKINKV
ncbi:MAG: KH domain-containing protein [Candidatus Micrarchaeia archaeon]